MKYRRLGKTNFEVSEISLGTWQVGGGWGSEFDDEMAEEILNTAVDRGINFLDTADVYDDRASEAAVGRVVESRSEPLHVATKCGRRLQPHVGDSYTPAAMRQFVEQSLENTGLDTLDLIQLHCPPTEVYYRPEVFEVFDRLKQEGKIRNLGVSVEKVEEGLKAIEYPNVATVQIIFNMFRHRPAELFFSEARRRDVGIIVRVPLASGLLSGKLSRGSTFDEGDHRNFNREGAAFDKGETFAGVPFETGLDAVESLKMRLDDDRPLPMLALKWILMHGEVSTVIPGASRPSQVEQNVEASETEDLTPQQVEVVDDVYGRYIREYVHQRW
ncbi:MAG: aldo/keto reductase [Spirochaetes bacterium]|jgi:aryl-alcohol dehydrogenase-like predicted oxidoreductase|nr:aldo/keto reductase [Spirochaetota bacterium]